MIRTNLTQYDEMPESMINYLRYYGPHFSKKLCAFATSKMYKRDSTGRKVAIKPLTKEQVNNMLALHGIKLENDQLYDSVYVANMCKADFLGSSIVDDAHLVKYIKDVIDDDDAYDGIVFNRFYADCCYSGVIIPWEEVL